MKRGFDETSDAGDGDEEVTLSPDVFPLFDLPSEMTDICVHFMTRPTLFMYSFTNKKALSLFKDPHYLASRFLLDCAEEGSEDLVIWALNNSACILHDITSLHELITLCINGGLLKAVQYFHAQADFRVHLKRKLDDSGSVGTSGNTELAEWLYENKLVNEFGVLSGALSTGDRDVVQHWREKFSIANTFSVGSLEAAATSGSLTFFQYVITSLFNDEVRSIPSWWFAHFVVHTAESGAANIAHFILKSFGNGFHEDDYRFLIEAAAAVRRTDGRIIDLFKFIFDPANTDNNTVRYLVSLVSSDALNNAARDGSVDVLIYLLSLTRVQVDMSHLFKVASRISTIKRENYTENLEIMKYLNDQGAHWPRTPFARVLPRFSPATIRWLLENGCSILVFTLDHFIPIGNNPGTLELLRYLHEWHAIQPSEHLLSSALVCPDLRLLEWARVTFGVSDLCLEKIEKELRTNLKRIAQSCTFIELLHLLRWLHRNVLPVSPGFVRAAQQSHGVRQFIAEYLQSMFQESQSENGTEVSRKDNRNARFL